MTKRKCPNNRASITMMSLLTSSLIKRIQGVILPRLQTRQLLSHHAGIISTRIFPADKRTLKVMIKHLLQLTKASPRLVRPLSQALVKVSRIKIVGITNLSRMKRPSWLNLPSSSIALSNASVTSSLTSIQVLMKPTLISRLTKCPTRTSNLIFSKRKQRKVQLVLPRKKPRRRKLLNLQSLRLSQN